MRKDSDRRSRRAGKPPAVPAVLLLILCSSSGPAPCETDRFELSGYTALYPAVERYDGSAARYYRIERTAGAVLSGTRLRAEVDLGEGGLLAADYEVTGLYHGSSPLFPVPSGRAGRQYLDMTWKPVSREHTTVVHTIDRLYWRYGFSSGTLTAGRQRISWGTGRIWNPTDLFNQINPASYSQLEKSGADALSLKFFFGPFTDIEAVLRPGRGEEPTDAGGRFRTNAGEYDISLAGGRFDGRIAAGGDFAGNLFDAGLRGEGIVSIDEKDSGDVWVKWILGIDNQFTPEIYALAEYHHNGEGMEDPRDYDLERLAEGGIVNLARSYLFLRVDCQVHPLVRLGSFVNHGFTDSSGFGGVTAEWSLSGNSDIGMGVQHAYGGEFDEYWYYPSTCYGSMVYYF